MLGMLHQKDFVNIQHFNLFAVNSILKEGKTENID